MKITDNIPDSLKLQAIVDEHGEILGFKCYFCTLKRDVFRHELRVTDTDKPDAPPEFIDAWMCHDCAQKYVREPGGVQ